MLGIAVPFEVARPQNFALEVCISVGAQPGHKKIDFEESFRLVTSDRIVDRNCAGVLRCAQDVTTNKSEIKATKKRHSEEWRSELVRLTVLPSDHLLGGFDLGRFPFHVSDAHPVEAAPDEECRDHEEA